VTIFQSTSSVWRTTAAVKRHVTDGKISIHVLRVEDDTREGERRPNSHISIHVLRVEDDAAVPSSITGTLPFQSTSSVWRTTWPLLTSTIQRLISIHVLRVEDDKGCAHCKRAYTDFNPRPPCGGRLGTHSRSVYGVRFQSTSSVWRTTTGGFSLQTGDKISIHVLRVEDDRAEIDLRDSLHISIHVLRVEDDRWFGFRRTRGSYFNPRPPCGGRRDVLSVHGVEHPISIHVLRVEDDLSALDAAIARGLDFNPRPPCGGRPQF